MSNAVSKVLLCDCTIIHREISTTISLSCTCTIKICFFTINYRALQRYCHTWFWLHRGDPTARLARNWFWTTHEEAFRSSALCFTAEITEGSFHHHHHSDCWTVLTNHSSTHIFTRGNQSQLPEVNYTPITRIHNRAKISVTIWLLEWELHD